MQARLFTVPAYVLIVSGVITVSGTLPAMHSVLIAFLDLAFWPVDGAPAAIEPGSLLLAAIAGGIMAGWGVFMLMLAQGRTPSTALLAGALCWFVLDSTGSALSGAPMNAVFNLGFLAVILLPLLRPRDHQASS